MLYNIFNNAKKSIEELIKSARELGIEITATTETTDYPPENVQDKGETEWR